MTILPSLAFDINLVKLTASKKITKFLSHPADTVFLHHEPGREINIPNDKCLSRSFSVEHNIVHLFGHSFAPCYRKQLFYLWVKSQFSHHLLHHLLGHFLRRWVVPPHQQHIFDTLTHVLPFQRQEGDKSSDQMFADEFAVPQTCWGRSRATCISQWRSARQHAPVLKHAVHIFTLNQ